MSEMQEFIIDTTEKIMDKYSTKDVINNSEGGQWATHLWSQLVESGMITVAIPEELGGNGGDFSDAFSMLRIAGKYSAPIPLAETFIANWMMAEHGERITDEIITIAYPVESNFVKFIQNDDGWIISGKLRDVPWARFANKMVVFGETDKGSIISLISLNHARIFSGNNLAGDPRDDVIFENVYLQDCNLIKVNMKDQLETLSYAGALTRCVMMAGALETVLKIAIRHTSERSQFGKSLNRFQAIQQHIAILAGETAAASMASDYAVQSFSMGNYSNELAFAKVRINEAAGKVAQLAHQILAAIGFTYEHTLHHSTRRLWAWRDEYGTESEWQKVITKKLMNLEKNQLWSMITNVETNLKKVES